MIAVVCKPSTVEYDVCLLYLCVLRWLISPIRDRHVLSQWGQLTSVPVTADWRPAFLSLSFLAALLSSLFCRRWPSKISTPLWMELLQVSRCRAWCSQVFGWMKHCLRLWWRVSLYRFLWPPCVRFPFSNWAFMICFGSQPPSFLTMCPEPKTIND